MNFRKSARIRRYNGHLPGAPFARNERDAGSGFREEEKMRNFGSLAIVAATVISLCPATAHAALSGLTQVASGLNTPIFVTHAPGDRDRLFIAERGGAIKVLDLNTGVVQATPFLTMSVAFGIEGGLLGLAFHPDYFDEQADGFGKFYVKMTTSGSALTVRIREFSVSEANPNLADAGSLREVLSYTNPQGNHVGGWIGFSPNNKYLYIANGDGGGGFDGGDGSPGHTAGTGNAQDITNNVLGKMLRIDPLDPDGAGSATYSIPADNPMVAGVGDPADDVGDDVIWAYGLRNPFRSSFDRITGDLWIGDVGQNQREEIDFEAASSAGGLNFGWRYREGFAQTQNVGLPYDTDWTQPVYDYNRDADQFGGTVVTGGYVYRGPDPSLQGQYFFADSRNTGDPTDDNYWMFDPDNPFGTVQNIDTTLGIPTTNPPVGGTHRFPASFGEDAKGNLYVAYITSGQVYRIATNQLLPGDFDADGEVDAADFDEWRRTFGAALANPAADGNGNGIADAADYVVWRKNLGRSVHDSPGSGAAVPEPATATLMFPAIALMTMSAMSRRRNSGVAK
jgi:glucose/arabinose dehydrogenase